MECALRILSLSVLGLETMTPGVRCLAWICGCLNETNVVIPIAPTDIRILNLDKPIGVSLSLPRLL